MSRPVPWLLTTLLALPACKEGGAPGAVRDDLRTATVAAIGACTLEVYRAFLPAAQALGTATAALAQEPGTEQRAAARTAWLDAIGRWQEAELFQYGPAARAGTPGAQELRSQIYSWPEVSPCFVDQLLVSEGYRDLARADVTVRGLAVAEYLLFNDDTGTRCPATAAISMSGSWAALAGSAAELDRRRRTYAAAVAAEVAARARALVAAWEPDGGNFLGQLGGSGRVYRSPQHALNAISDAFFYIERPLKDEKLARPIGDKQECAQPPCLTLLESRFAGASREHLRRNLDGFEKMFFGCGSSPEPHGFDDLLRAVNAGGAAEQVRTDLSAVRQAFMALPGATLDEALTTDLPSVRRVQEALKMLVVTLKTQVTGVLNLAPPKDVEQDND